MKPAIGAAIASLMLSLPSASLADTANDFREMDHSRDIPALIGPTGPPRGMVRG